MLAHLPALRAAGKDGGKGKMSRKGKMDIWLFLAVIGLAAVLGAILWRGRPDLSDAERERARVETAALAEKLALDVEQKRALSGWILAAKVVGGGLALVGIAGLAFVSLRWLDRRAAEVRPGPDGQFPLVRVRIRGATIIHDPNRQLAAATVYARDDQADRVAIIPVITGSLSTQERTAARAQAVALTSAAHRHPPIMVTGGGRATLPATVDADQVDETPEPIWPSRVPLLSLLNGSTSLARLVIGVTVDETSQSHIVTGDMARMVHVAVGGTAGWGKSVFLQALAYQLATCSEKPQLVMVDLDGVTLSPFANCDRLLYPFVDTERDALAVFAALADELEQRKAAFDRVEGCIDLATYNARVNDPLAPIVCLTDEATALLGDKGVEAAIRRLALRGRKFGLWIVLAGQNWKASSLDTAIRDQLSTRIQFRAMSPSQSRVLLMQGGAESLPVPGRALAILPGQEVQEIQAAQVSYSDIMAALAGQCGPHQPLPGAGDADRADRIRQLANQGLSQREIEQEVFNYTGGTAYKEVKRVLDGE